MGRSNDFYDSRPCGSMNPKIPFMVDGVCSKGYPKRFRPATIEVEGFPAYKRPDDGRAILENGVLLTNQRVAPHNPWMCAKYNDRINLEVCSSADAANYLCKYV